MYDQDSEEYTGLTLQERKLAERVPLRLHIQTLIEKEMFLLLLKFGSGGGRVIGRAKTQGHGEAYLWNENKPGDSM
jgi:hypothetical protein